MAANSKNITQEVVDNCHKNVNFFVLNFLFKSYTLPKLFHAVSIFVKTLGTKNERQSGSIAEWSRASVLDCSRGPEFESQQGWRTIYMMSLLYIFTDGTKSR